MRVRISGAATTELEAIAAYIRKPANVMPPYVEKVLGDSDVRDIQAYLASIPQPKPLKDIPLLAP